MASLLLAKHAKTPHPPQHHFHSPQQFKASCGRENLFFGNENLIIQTIVKYI